MRRELIVLFVLICLFAAFSLMNLNNDDAAETIIIDNERITSEDKMLAEKHIVGIAHGEDYESTTRQAIKESGGLNNLIKPNDTVLIKPNIVGPGRSGAGRITDYRVVQAVVNMALEADAGNVIVAEGPVDCSWYEGFSIAGYFNIENAELEDLNATRSRTYKLSPVNSFAQKPIFLPQLYMDADVVIGVSVLKTHYTTGVTLSLKNIGMGVPPLAMYGPGHKRQLHDFGINNVIADVNTIRIPDFSVIDAMVAGEADGPIRPDPKRMNTVIAGQNPVAVDTIGTKVMGFEPTEITHLVYSAAQNIGSMNLNNIEIRGQQIEDVQTKLVPPSLNQNPFKATTIIAHTPEKLVIDGELSEWNTPWQNKINRPGQAWNDKEEITIDDFNAITMLMYDDTYLYVGITIEGQTIKSNQKLIEILLSFSNNYDTFLRRRYVAGNDRRLVVEYNDGFHVEDAVSQEIIKDIEIASTTTGIGYVLEMAIPFDSIGVDSPNVYDELGVDFIINQALDSEVSAYLSWNRPKDQRTNPLHLGRALFLHPID